MLFAVLYVCESTDIQYGCSIAVRTDKSHSRRLSNVFSSSRRRRNKKTFIGAQHAAPKEALPGLCGDKNLPWENGFPTLSACVNIKIALIPNKDYSRSNKH